MSDIASPALSNTLGVAYAGLKSYSASNQFLHSKFKNVHKDSQKLKYMYLEEMLIKLNAN